MRASLTRTAVVTAVLVTLGVGGGAHAVDPFEIQIYEGDIDDPLQAGLELHTNYVAAGRSTPAFPGELPPDGVLRTTLEPSFGVLRWWELGAYLQLVTAPERPEAHYAGFKLRSKFIVPRERSAPLVLGLNVELARGVAVLGSAGWDTEVRPIVARTFGRWFFAANPILGWALTGDTSWAPELEPGAKIRFDTRHRVGVGVEYYAGLGRLNDLAAWRDQEHFLYVAGDLLDGPIELNVAVGHGLTPASDAWTLKSIVGTTF